MKIERAEAKLRTSGRKPRKTGAFGKKAMQSRATLIEAAGRLMLERGYGVVTSRAIAEEAGVAHQLIFYYFKTLDDLLVEVFRIESAVSTEKLERALSAEQPLRALWEVLTDARLSRFVQEFVALANHNDHVRDEIARNANDFHDRITETVTKYLDRCGVDPVAPPAVIVMLMTGLARLLVNNAALGLTAGHAEAKALVEACLQQVEMSDPATVAARKIFRKADLTKKSSGGRSSRRARTSD